MLTDLGARLARAICVSHNGGNGQLNLAECQSAGGLGQAPVPHWFKRDRELRLGSHLVKWFRQLAPDQELVLDTFQAMRWCACISEPLVHRPGRDPQQHLHETIHNLNRAQHWPFVWFGGDGTGCGILYRVVLTLPTKGRGTCLGPCYARLF